MVFNALNYVLKASLYAVFKPKLASFKFKIDLGQLICPPWKLNTTLTSPPPLPPPVLRGDGAGGNADADAHAADALFQIPAKILVDRSNGGRRSESPVGRRGWMMGAAVRVR